MKKAVIKLMGMALALLVLLHFISPWLDSDSKYRQKLETFYELPENSVNILIFGNSHAVTALNPAILNAQLGVNTYNLGQGGQELIVTYHYMQEALKYQKPQLIILEAYNTRGVNDTRSLPSNLQSLHALRPSINKYEAIANYVPPAYYIEALLPAVSMHHNWSVLPRSDVSSTSSSYPLSNGFRAINSQLSPQNFQLYKSDSIKDAGQNFVPLLQQKRYWLKKIKDLCKRHEVPLLFTVTPILPAYLQDRQYHLWSDNLAEASKLYKLFYFDMNSQQLQKRWKRGHFANEVSSFHHVNKDGAALASKLLGQYIRQQKLVSSKRADTTWQEVNASIPQFYEYKTNLDLLSDQLLEQRKDGISYFYNKPERAVFVRIGKKHQQMATGQLVFHFIPEDETALADYGLEGKKYAASKVQIERPSQPWSPQYTTIRVDLPEYAVKSIRFGPARDQELSFEPWWLYFE